MDKRLSYRLGKFYKQKPKQFWAVVLLLPLLLYTCSAIDSAADSRQKEQELAVIAQRTLLEKSNNEKNAALALEKELQRRQNCTSTASQLAAEAKKEMTAGLPHAAKFLLGPCADNETLAPLMQQAKNQIKVVEEKAALANVRKVASERKKAGVAIGMTEEEVIASSWGKPQKVNRTTSAFGTREQWVYGSNYLYFQHGKLVTIQN